MNILFRRSVSQVLEQTRCICLGIPKRDYESSYSINKLYPNSSNRIRTPNEEEIVANSKQKFSGYIPLDKLMITESRSSGPGGQHVNKVNSKVEVRFHLESADWIPEVLRKRLLELKKNQLSKEGYWIIRSDKTRSQQLNKADVLQRIRSIIYNCEEMTTEPDPELEVTIRKRKERANEERLKLKRHRSLIRQMKTNYE